MSAHFDGGAEIAGRRLREVEVMYVDDATLNLDAEDSDDCPPSPPPTYYLRVREEKGAKHGEKGMNGNLEATDLVSSIHLSIVPYVCVFAFLFIRQSPTPPALFISVVRYYSRGSGVRRAVELPCVKDFRGCCLSYFFLMRISKLSSDHVLCSCIMR